MELNAEIKARLERELQQTTERLRQQGGVLVIENYPGAVGDDRPLADSTDEIQINGERETGVATRSILVKRVNKLAEALERLRRGSYGLCEECGKPIAPARLKAMPEVTTCVNCQDRIEREDYRFDDQERSRFETVWALYDGEENEE